MTTTQDTSVGVEAEAKQKHVKGDEDKLKS